MSYTIEVHYSTGDSFKTYDETHDVGLIWNDKALAIKALSHIKEQHQLYYQLDLTYDRKEREKLIQSIISKEWIDQSKTLLQKQDHWKFSISCLMDDGSYRTLRTNWLGHFERLMSAKIKRLNSDDEEYIPD